LAFGVLIRNDSLFPSEYFGKKVSIAASWLQESGIYPFGFLFYEVEHGIHFTLSGKDFAVVGNSFF
jgi:hypothetical protein